MGSVYLLRRLLLLQRQVFQAPTDRTVAPKVDKEKPAQLPRRIERGLFPGGLYLKR